MKKLFAVALAIVMVLTLSASAVLASPPGDKGIGPAGESNVAHINLWQLDWVQIDGEWVWVDILKGGAWARLKYNISGPTFDFVLNGHGLNPDTEYSLVVVVFNPYGNELYWAEEITSGTPNGGGELHIAGSYDFGRDIENADVWIVPSDNVIPTNGLSYLDFSDFPEEYLFGTDDILNHDDTDVP